MPSFAVPPLRALCASILSCLVLLPALAAGPGPSLRASAELLVVGDLAQCGRQAPGDTPTARVAQLLAGGTSPIAMVGDLAYVDGTREEFLRCFDPVWGRFKPRILPVPGNHEYNAPGTPYFFEYFADTVPGLGQGYYARQVGAWRVIALNSNIDVAPGSPQGLWLERELAEHPSRCTLALWHHPRHSSGRHGPTAHMEPFWRDLHEAGVELVVSGHDHDYERFSPQGPEGRADAAGGIRQFVVGTGGARLRRLDDVAAHSEVRDGSTFGVLRLTLSDDRYAWAFLPVDGSSFRDQGEGACH